MASLGQKETFAPQSPAETGWQMALAKLVAVRRGAITRTSAAGHCGFLRDSFLKFVLIERNDKIASC
jgi:hypothetical protein